MARFLPRRWLDPGRPSGAFASRTGAGPAGQRQQRRSPMARFRIKGSVGAPRKRRGRRSDQRFPGRAGRIRGRTDGTIAGAADSGRLFGHREPRKPAARSRPGSVIDVKLSPSALPPASSCPTCSFRSSRTAGHSSRQGRPASLGGSAPRLVSHWTAAGGGRPRRRWPMDRSRRYAILQSFAAGLGDGLPSSGRTAGEVRCRSRSPRWRLVGSRPKLLEGAPRGRRPASRSDTGYRVAAGSKGEAASPAVATTRHSPAP